MMEQKLKHLLAVAFAAPPPERKEEFLRRIACQTNRAPMRKTIVFTQIFYIHKRAWIGALAVLCAIIGIVSNAEEHRVFLIAAMMPFLALAVLAEGERSHSHSMAELEAATRYSLRSVVFCRMLILGVFDLVFMLLLTLATKLYTEHGLLLSISYILLPYLLTMWTGLVIELSRFGRDHPHAAGMISIAVSVSLIILANSNHFILGADYGIWWEIVTILLLIGTVLKGRDKMKRLEEPAWS